MPATARRHRSGRRPGVSETRPALLAAATELFAEHGYDGVAVGAIAEKAGVNRAMISYHFGGKRQLYREIVTSTLSEIAERVEHVARMPGPAPERLRDVIAVVGDVATRQCPHFAAMFLREVLAGGANLEPAVLELPVRVLSAVQRIVERGVRERSLRAVDPVMTHMSMVGSLVFFFATAPFRERVLARYRPGTRLPEPAAYVRHVQELVMRGFASDPPTPGPDRRRSNGR